jgi:spermidine/putrescine transport system substrate-binding protein
MLLCLLAPAASGWATEELRILSGGHIIPPAVVEAFEKKHHLRIRIESFDSHETLAAYLETDPQGDLALLRGHHVSYLRERNRLAPVNHALLPNLKNLWPQALNSPVDAGAAYSVPYLQGTLGLLYRRDLFGGRKPGWNSLFDRRAAVTPFAVTDQYRDAMGVALLYLGYSYNNPSPAALGRAAEALQGLAGHPAFMGFLSVESLGRFVREQFIYLAVTYNNVAARAIEDDPSLAFNVPEHGAVSWTYAFVINKKSRNLEAVHQWLNYLLEPEVAAEVSAWNRAASPNRAALAFIPDGIKSNTVIYPPNELLYKAQAPLSLGAEAEKQMTEYWSNINR